LYLQPSRPKAALSRGFQTGNGSLLPPIRTEKKNPADPDKPGFIGVWDITDNGDVPPRGIIKGPASQVIWPAGVALNPGDREVYTIDSVSNGMYSYHTPEFFPAKKR